MNRLSELYFAIPDYMKDCTNYIPERAGILILSRCEYGIDLQKIREPQKNNNRRKFTDEEMLKIAHLGTMRIWTLNENYRHKKKSFKETIYSTERTIKFGNMKAIILIIFLMLPVKAIAPTDNKIYIIQRGIDPIECYGASCAKWKVVVTPGSSS